MKIINSNRMILIATLAGVASLTYADDQAPVKGAQATVAAVAEVKPVAETPMTEDWKSGTFSIGAQQRDVDTISSKFTEYREVPNGVIAPSFRFQGQKHAFRYDFFGENVKQTDPRFRMRMGEDKWRLEGEYNRIPHNFGNGGHTLLQQTSEGVWEMSDSLQRYFQTTIEAAPRSALTYPFLLNLVSPSLAAANQVDVKLTRERGDLTFIAKPSDPTEFRFTYARERRTGSRAASGTSFGFGNVVELPEPLHYLTEDFGGDGQYEGSWGVLRGGVHYNRFQNSVQSLTFDNPFRITDSTDGAAYTAPGSGSVSGPVTGRISLPPDNETVIANASVMFKIKNRTRLTADASIGQWSQNKSPFLAYTTNTAIISPLNAANVSTLPASKLDGKADVKSFNAFFTSQPVKDLWLTARFRAYELDNKTPRIRTPGYVRFDGVWEDFPRISVPYGYKNDRLDATVGYRFRDVSLEGGFKHIKMERTFRETEETSENGFTAAATLHTSDWLVLRGSYEKSKRDFAGLEIGKSEDASFQAVTAPANLLAVPSNTLQTSGQPLCPSGTICNLRYDQANKDTERIGTTASLSPNDKVTFSVGYSRTKDDYPDSQFGLLTAKLDSISVDVDLSPNEKASLYAFYSYEKVANFQVGRQSGATVSTNVLDNWTSDVADKVNSIGAGADFTLVPEKWLLKLYGRYQKVNGNNSLFAPAGGAPALARTGIGGVQSFGTWDDTDITTVSAEAKYQFATDWAVSLGAWIEDYKFNDLASDGLTNYVPASLFLAANDGSYTAKVAYVRFTYHW